MENTKSKSDPPLLTIVILNIRSHFLLPLTINSILSQKEKNFEIIVYTQNILKKDLAHLRQFAKYFKNIHVPIDISYTEIKNRALKKVNGTYVHYVFPGEYYLSNHSLTYAFSKIINRKYPDLICFSFLRRDFLSPPEVRHASFSLSFIGEERFPLLSREVFYKKDVLEKLGGFDKRYVGLEGFDAISKIHLNKGSRVLCCRRVIVDYELQKHHPSKVKGYLLDLIMITYRRYGFFSLFKKIILKEIIDLIKSWIKSVKGLFLQSE